MIQQLTVYCKSLGIDEFGIASTGPYMDLAVQLEKRIASGHITEFDELNISKRIRPELLLPNVQSIIVCLFPYYIGTAEHSNLSKYTYGLDYHRVINSKLESIGQFLQGILPDFCFQAYADTGPLADRYLAWLAGLGYYGINSCLINDRYGSWFFIGYIVNNYPFPIGKPQHRTCLQCGNCVEACPGQIIIGNGSIDPRGCKSYLTQKKGDLSPAEKAILQKTSLIFGCDVCQDVCPHNNLPETAIAEFRQHLLTFLPRNQLESLSNKEFQQHFGNRAFSWRGKKILLRNMDILEEVAQKKWTK